MTGPGDDAGRPAGGRTSPTGYVSDDPDDAEPDEVLLEAVVQDGGPLAGPGRAACRQPGEQAQGCREPGDFGLSREQDLPDQLQPGVPAFGFAGIVEAGRLEQVRDGLGAPVFSRG